MIARFASVASVLALAAVIVIPSLPSGIFGRRFDLVSNTIAYGLRKIGVIERWAMYAPNPYLAHHYMNLTAHFRDGRTEDLEENELERDGWDTRRQWEWTREDLWRFYVLAHPEREDRYRSWYLRGVCIREARRHGELPDEIVMTRVTRVFPAPEQVRRGSPPIGPRERRVMETLSCQDAIVRQMLEGDDGADRS